MTFADNFSLRGGGFFLGALIITIQYYCIVCRMTLVMSNSKFHRIFFRKAVVIACLCIVFLIVWLWGFAISFVGMDDEVNIPSDIHFAYQCSVGAQ